MAGQAEPAPSANIFDLFKQQALYGIQFAKRYPQYHELGKRFSSEQGNNIYEVVIQQLAMDQKEDKMFELLFSEAYQNGDFNMHYSLEFINRLCYFFSTISMKSISMQKNPKKTIWII